MATLLDQVKRWNSSWRYDYWWRQKHRVAYNSLEHRSVTPLDVAFEYAEHMLSQAEIKQQAELERRAKLLKDGLLFEVREDSELWKKIDLNSFR